MYKSICNQILFKLIHIDDVILAKIGKIFTIKIPMILKNCKVYAIHAERHIAKNFNAKTKSTVDILDTFRTRKLVTVFV